MVAITIELPADQMEALRQLVEVMKYDDFRFFAGSENNALAVKYAFVNLREAFKALDLVKGGE